MTPFKTAEKFFHNCESSAGWEACKEYVASDAPFIAQSEPLVDVKTVKDYVDWMAGFGTVTAPRSKYELHTSAYVMMKQIRQQFFLLPTSQRTREKEVQFHQPIRRPIVIMFMPLK